MRERLQLAAIQLEPDDQDLREVGEPADDLQVACPRHALQVHRQVRTGKNTGLLVGDEAEVEVVSEVATMGKIGPANRNTALGDWFSKNDAALPHESLAPPRPSSDPS
jgi:hypothetical protein